jgi:hypothetical protein
VPTSNLQLVRPVRLVPIVVLRDQTPPVFEATSPRLSPIGAYHHQEHRFVEPPAAGGEVTVTCSAVGDFGADNEYLTVRINGTAVARVFEFGAHDCPDAPDIKPLTFTLEEWSQLVAADPDGDVVIKFYAAATVNHDPPGCLPDTYVQVGLHYDEAVEPNTEPPEIIWRSEEPVLLGNGETDYLEAEWQWDPVTGQFVVVMPSATLNKVTLSGLNVGFDEEGAAYLCSESTFEIRGVVLRTSSGGQCPPI